LRRQKLPIERGSAPDDDDDDDEEEKEDTY